MRGPISPSTLGAATDKLKSHMLSDSKMSRWILALVFAFGFRQKALYSSNQNTYFLHGLAQAEAGPLATDWLAQTADPFPLFSALVRATVSVGSPKLFHLLYIILLTVFAYSVLGIIAQSGLKAQNRARFSFVLMLPLLLWSAQGTLSKGLANQYILGQVFQPSVFGIFLLASVYAFLREKFALSVCCLALAANFHTTYLMSAGVLTMIYMGIVAVHYRRPSQALILGLCAFVLVIPSLYYAYSHFSTGDAAIIEQAHRILVEERIPHHALPRVWFKKGDSFKILILLAATYSTTDLRLRLILGVSILVGAALTLVQLLTGSLSLALLFPWRLSAFMMPLASALLLARALEFLLQRCQPNFDWWRATARWLVVGVAATLVVVAYKQTMRWISAPREGSSAVTRFAHESYQSGDIYLIPPKLSDFRLAAQLPVFVDHKSHPYKAPEVIEWYKRVNLAKGFYTDSKGCESLLNLQREYGITHVVTFRKKKQPKCELLTRVRRDRKLVLYKIRLPPRDSRGDSTFHLQRHPINADGLGSASYGAALGGSSPPRSGSIL